MEDEDDGLTATRPEGESCVTINRMGFVVVEEEGGAASGEDEDEDDMDCLHSSCCYRCYYNSLLTANLLLLDSEK